MNRTFPTGSQPAARARGPANPINNAKAVDKPSDVRTLMKAPPCSGTVPQSNRKSGTDPIRVLRSLKAPPRPDLLLVQGRTAGDEQVHFDGGRLVDEIHAGMLPYRRPNRGVICPKLPSPMQP